MMVPSLSIENQQWRLCSSRKMMLSCLILHMFITIAPCDGMKKRRIRATFGEPSNGRHTSSDDLNHFVFKQSRVVEHAFDDDEDRHDQDPENQDPDNPDNLTWLPSISPLTGNPTPVPTLAPVTSLPTAVPTKIDGSVPTKSPSGSSPFASPTRSPTLSSTKAPSRSPFSAPSSPSKAPTTKAPSKSPTTIAPTKAPTTKSPSKSPTSIAPTKAPSKSPATNAPSSTTSESPTCVYDTSSGTVGNVVDFPATEMNYVYEIQTKSNSTASMDGDIIPALETKILNALAPDFISSGCVPSGRRGRNLATEDAEVFTMSTMSGISVKPADRVLQRSCLQPPATGSCTAVLGMMSVYVAGISDGWSTDLMNAIEKGMLNDTFVDAHPSINKVVFIGEDYGNPFPPTPSPTGTGTTPTVDEGTTIGGGMMALYVVLGVGSLVSLVALGNAAARRRRRVSNGIEYEESLSSGVSIGSIKDLGDFEHSNPHDLDTVRVSNRELEDDLEVNVDLESFESKENEDGCFDFFDLILEGSSPNGTQVRTRGIPPKEGSLEDMSEISF